jgi:hypothetical protein
MYTYTDDDCNIVLIPALGSIPAGLRLLQTCKRFWDTLKINHFINIVKYGLNILAIWMSFAYHFNLIFKDKPGVNQVLWVLAQLIASIYSFCWDVKMDWSLFKLKSVNYLLRDELGFEHHWPYYCAIVLNFILRMSWALLFIDDNPRSPVQRTVFIIAFCEMIR